jgi:hypothetical protein
MSLRVCSILLTLPELVTPTRGKPSSYAMAGGNASLQGQAPRFTSRNPFEALEDSMRGQSDGSGSSASPNSSGGSMSHNDYGSSAVTLASPTRGFDGDARLALEQRVSMRLLRLICERFADCDPGYGCAFSRADTPTVY